MATLDELRKRLDDAAALSDPLDRRLLLVGVLAERLKGTQVVPIMVGGAAVEFYTAGGYSTTDVDLVADPVEVVSQAFADLGFTKTGRYWSRPDLDEAVETPPGPLAGDVNRVVRVEIDGLMACVIGIEDLIIDRLNAYVHWRSDEDGRWAQRLIFAGGEDLDLEYLRQRSVEERTSDALESMLGATDR